MFGFIFCLVIIAFLVSTLNKLLGVQVGFFISKERLQEHVNKKNKSSITEVDPSTNESEILHHYRDFSRQDFLQKASKAFEIIFTAYAAGDVRTLRTLLTPRIFKAFSMAIDDRKSRKETLEGSILRIVDSSILNVATTDDDLIITVRFTTEQVNVLKNESGQIIEGDPDFIETRIDTWKFSRKKASNDPRWFLHEIESES